MTKKKQTQKSNDDSVSIYGQKRKRVTKVIVIGMALLMFISVFGSAGIQLAGL